MTPILITIPVTAANAAATEQMLDFIFELENKQQTGACLLVVDPNVHAELKERVQIAAEIAFDHLDLVTSSGMSKNPVEEIAGIVRDRYRCPWFLMEPDCVPLKKGWRESLASAYQSQPFKFAGVKQSRKVESATVFRVHPTAIYPPDGSLTTDKGVVARTSTTRLISLMTFQRGMTLDKIDQNAVVLKGDSTGDVIRMMREKNQPKASQPTVDAERVANETGTMVRVGKQDILPNSQQNGNGRVRSVFPAETLEEAVRITQSKAKKRGRKKKESNV